MNKLYLLLSLLLFLSCHTKHRGDEIIGVWIFDNQVNDLYLNDTSGIFRQQYPIIFDFRDVGMLVRKNYGYRDTTLNWSINSDTILTMGNVEYFIQSLNKDSINLRYRNDVDTYLLTLTRPNEVKLSYSKDNIEKILLTNIWTIDDTLNNNWASHFEYFNNGTMLYRYKMSNPDLSDIKDNIQLETWGVAEYSGYYFLYSYNDMAFGNGVLDRINQIIDINDTSYVISDTRCNTGKTKFTIKRLNSQHNTNCFKIKGDWKSYNSRNNDYGTNIPKRAIKLGRMALYEGILELEIQEKTLKFKINGTEPLEYNWQLSKDGRILVLEQEINDPDRKGIAVTYADILELTDNKLKVYLFYNSYNTKKDKPQTYILNTIQEFKKVN
jgi:hypothetical protein